MTMRITSIIAGAASLLSGTALAGGYVAAPIIDAPPVITSGGTGQTWIALAGLVIIAVLIGKGNRPHGNPAKSDGGACFLEGTAIYTPCGWVPVEELRPGQKVLTPAGHQKIVHVASWLPTDHSDRPVIVGGVHLSPRHRIQRAGEVVDAGEASDERAALDGRRYYHVLLADHTWLFAHSGPGTKAVLAESLMLTPDMALGRAMPDLAAHHAANPATGVTA